MTFIDVVPFPIRYARRGMATAGDCVLEVTNVICKGRNDPPE